MLRYITITTLMIIGLASFAHAQGDKKMTDKVVKTEPQWKEELTEEEYYILREKGTEKAFKNEYNDHKGHGDYVCAACGQKLFSSDAKYDSGSGWPSYFQPVDEGHVVTKEDNTFFMKRTEVLCSRCDGHLGHVFNDGPQPTGLRYCINSAALDFVEEPSN